MCMINGNKIQYNNTKLFASNFYLSTDIVDHNFSSSNILLALTNFAASGILVYKTISFFARFLNEKIVIANLIRSMYFVDALSTDDYCEEPSSAFSRNIDNVKLSFINEWFSWSKD